MQTSDFGRKHIGIGAGSAFLAVALGAFGAHALRSQIPADRIETYVTAAHYHLIHSVAIVCVGLIAGTSSDSKFLTWAGRLFLGGILLFSGSLYLLGKPNPFRG